MLMEFQLPVFEKLSHKGECGKVLVVGGSQKYYGAPIFAALAAERTGADLITVFAPKMVKSVLPKYSLNSFINEFVMQDLCLKDIGLIVEASKQNDCLAIGMGLNGDDDTRRASNLIISDTDIPVVIDADSLHSALIEVIRNRKNKNIVLTPHKGEFVRAFGENADVASIAKDLGIVIVLKGPVDIVAGPTGVYENHTGHPKMRIGGTGDALAGIIAGFIAMGISPFEAAKSACYHYGLLGEELAKRTFAFRTYDLIKAWPKFLMRFV